MSLGSIFRLTKMFSIFLSQLYKVLSSAKLQTPDLMIIKDKSLMIILNKSRPRIEPCGALTYMQTNN